MVIDAEINFKVSKFVKNTKNITIKIKKIFIKIYYFIGKIECYYKLIRKAYKIIIEKLKLIILSDNILQIIMKIINNTIKSNGFIFILLIFNIYFKITGILINPGFIKHS